MVMQKLRRELPEGMPRRSVASRRAARRIAWRRSRPRSKPAMSIWPKSDDWLGSFLHEVLAFRYGQQDGQIDSVSQFLNWAGTGSSKGNASSRAFIDRPLLPPAEVHGGWEEEQISCRCRARPTRPTACRA